MANTREELLTLLRDMEILENKVREGKKAESELSNLENKYEEIIRIEKEKIDKYYAPDCELK